MPSPLISISSKYRKYINTAFILGPMTMIMAFVGVTRNFGFHDGYFVKFITTWLTMFPIAFVCGLFIIPIGNKLTSKIHFKDESVEIKSEHEEILRVYNEI